MRLHFRDTNPDVIAALRITFGEDADYTAGDIFSSPADAIVSPANSFGWMDGGIDLIYVRRMGKVVEDRTKAAIAKLPFGELLVGQAIVIPTDYEQMPQMVVAPTMRVPRPTTPENVFLAARAAFHCALSAGLGLVACPGLGTWSGRVAPSDAAKAMRTGYDEERARFTAAPTPTHEAA